MTIQTGSTYNTVKNFIRDEIRPYLRSKNKKSLFIQIKELISLYKSYRYIPYQYIKSGLYANDNHCDIEAVLPPKLIFKLQTKLNPPAYLRNVNNKVIFREILEKNDIPGVRELVHIDKEGKIFDSHRQERSTSDAVRILVDHGDDLFMKPIDGTWGVGARRIPADENFAELVATSRNQVIQPLIVQHDMLRSMNATSVNTVRIDTLLDEGRWVSSAAVLRIGVHGSVVDNGEATGLTVGIDLDTGRLARLARRRAKFGTNSHVRHPDSGFVFEGRILPHWALLRETVVRAAEALRPLGSLGWDVAITPGGVVIIEANCYWGVNIIQTGWGGLGRTPVGRQARALHGLAPLPPARHPEPAGPERQAS